MNRNELCSPPSDRILIALFSFSNICVCMDFNLFIVRPYQTKPSKQRIFKLNRFSKLWTSDLFSCLSAPKQSSRYLFLFLLFFLLLLRAEIPVFCQKAVSQLYTFNYLPLLISYMFQTVDRQFDSTLKLKQQKKHVYSCIEKHPQQFEFD